MFVSKLHSALYELYDYFLSGTSGAGKVPKQMYRKGKALSTTEIEDTLNSSDAENISEYEDNEMNDINEPGISGIGRITYSQL